MQADFTKVFIGTPGSSILGMGAVLPPSPGGVLPGFGASKMGPAGGGGVGEYVAGTFWPGPVFTSDGGDNWGNTVMNPPIVVWGQTITSIVKEIAFLDNASVTDVYSTGDKGATFNLVGNIGWRPTYITPLYDGGGSRIIAGLSDAANWRISYSDDNGITWTDKVLSPVNPPGGATYLNFCMPARQADGKICTPVGVGGLNYRMYYSATNGANWLAGNLMFDVNTVVVFSSPNGTIMSINLPGGGVFDIHRHPQTGPATWGDNLVFTGPTPLPGPTYAYSSGPVNTGMLFAVETGNAYVTLDDGVTWALHQAGIGAASFPQALNGISYDAVTGWTLIATDPATGDHQLFRDPNLTGFVPIGTVFPVGLTGGMSSLVSF